MLEGTIVTDYEDGACVRVKVITSSSKDNPITLDTDNCVLKVRTSKPRENGKANMAVLSLLKDFFGAEVRLIRGSASTHKLIYVALEKSKIIEKLNSCLKNGTKRH